MTLILDEFHSPTVRLTLEDVAGRTHLPRSTTHRILDQLVRLEWLDHSAFGYSLGQRALSLGGGQSQQSEVRAASAASLHDLQVRTGLVVHLAVLTGGEICYLDKLGGPSAAAVPSRVGGRAAAHSTALGKAMLAWVSAEQVDEEVGREPTRYTSRTIQDLDGLHQQLNRIRQHQGLAYEYGESTLGVCCVAAAIRGPDGPVAAISLVGGDRTPLDRVAPLVAAAAIKVSTDLFPYYWRSLQSRRGHRVRGLGIPG